MENCFFHTSYIQKILFSNFEIKNWNYNNQICFIKKNSKIKIEVHPNDILETTMNFK